MTWFERALGPDLAELAAQVRQRNLPSLNDIPLYGRQRCRAKLGLPADDLDRAADLAEERRRNFADRLARAAAAQTGAGRHDTRLEMLVWPRAELEQAARRWPAVFTRVDNQADVEHRLRRHAAEHAGPITLVVGTADGLGEHLDHTGADVAEESTRLAYAAKAKALGATLAWPPGRNQPCWCGSTRKYKTCCGALRP